MAIDQSLKSFIEVPVDSHFSIHNLPYGVFRPAGGGKCRAGVALGDSCLDLGLLEEAGLLSVRSSGSPLFEAGSLDTFMAAGPSTWSQVRRRLQELLSDRCPDLMNNQTIREQALHRLSQISSELPVRIGDYTDFYSSREHATNVGIMFRGKENALMPNWLHLPVAYHGRSSSILPSGTPVHRPRGQTRPEGQETPAFGPCRLLDFELEMGYFVGPGNRLGHPISVEHAREHIFGMVLVNDWSARDIQAWEYVPLGPFLGKNFATTISPWVVPLEALEPFRCEGPGQDPAPLPYLEQPVRDSFDIQLEVQLKSPEMSEPYPLCRSNYRYLYWTLSQQLAHHTITGCNLRTGDLLATGTISGPDPGSFGSLLELSWRGSRPIALPNGDQRRFLVDGDEVSLTGWCQAEGYRVGFGSCSGTILPAVE